ncbi:glycosyltransferase [Patescibacteria group bacterium]|nr:glycosyltransferase [Patescibacteria group bacterium]
MKHPLVSIIITTKNEQRNIENCLKSIRQQSYKTIETIVVDNHSVDKTKEIALRYTDRVLEKGPERSAQRNFGINRATGKYVLYLDADMIMSKNVVRDCLKKVRKDPKIVALYISEVVVGKSFWCKVRRFERSFYDATVIDCVRFVSKKAFVAVKGFDESLAGPEDWDFDKKIRKLGKTDLVTTPIYHNEGDFRLGKYLTKKSYYIGSFDRYMKKWGKADPDIKKQLGFYYRYVGVFFERGKWKKLLVHPLLTLVMYFLRLLIGIEFLLK